MLLPKLFTYNVVNDNIFQLQLKGVADTAIDCSLSFTKCIPNKLSIVFPVVHKGNIIV